MKRTIAEARRVLEEDAAPHANDYRVRLAREVLAKAEAHAQATANSFLDRNTSELREVRGEALRELTEVRDGLDALATEGATGRIAAQGVRQPSPRPAATSESGGTGLGPGRRRRWTASLKSSRTRSRTTTTWPSAWTR